ncbi:MAG: isoprenylcysteine carboxylmethyltransferase family protein [Chloroflexi bacterium]|nr:isoprenylcysteine carboxylmethyltransferase family protein [Chloroflexota bacterium]
MTTETQIRIIAAILLVVTFAISGYYRRKAEQSGQSGDVDFSQEKTWVYRLRVGGALLGYGTMLAYLIYPPLVAWAQLDLPLALRWGGLAFMALMLPGIYWLFSHLGNNVTPTVSIRKKHKMVTTGPYRYIRHPLYTFGYLTFVGMSLSAANWFMFAMLTLGTTAVLERTRQEEANLLERFGTAYDEYMQRTGRFLPRISR